MCLLPDMSAVHVLVALCQLKCIVIESEKYMRTFFFFQFFQIENFKDNIHIEDLVNGCKVHL